MCPTINSRPPWYPQTKIDTTHRLNVVVAVYEHGLLLRIFTDPAEDGRREGQLLAVHDMLAEVDELGSDAEVAQLAIKPCGHPEDIRAVGPVPAYAVQEPVQHGGRAIALGGAVLRECDASYLGMATASASLPMNLLALSSMNLMNCSGAGIVDREKVG